MDLPLSLMRAISRALLWRDGEFSALAERDRLVLAEILRCIPKASPTEPVFVRRNTLAVRLDISLATLTRGMARLQDLGWIVRDQVKSRIRGFQVGSVALTSLAAERLGFGDTHPQAQRCAPLSDACSYSKENTEQSLERHPAQAPGPVVERRLECVVQPITATTAEENSALEVVCAVTPAAIELTETAKLDQPDDSVSRASSSKPRIRLPEPLAWLADHMTPAGVCLLMKEARDRGMRLEDVVSQCAEHVRKASNAFAYVRRLLAGDRDWSGAAKQSKEAAEQQAAAARTRLQFESELQALEGACFVGKDGFVRKVMRGMAVFFTPAEARLKVGTSSGARAVSQEFLCAVRDGLLMPWNPESGLCQSLASL